MQYKKLHQELSEMERQSAGNTTHRVPAGFAATLIQRSDGNFQFFALDENTQDGNLDLPVVVCIGSNYCQGPNTLPKPVNGGSVEAKLGAPRRNLVELFQRCRKDPATLKPLSFRDQRWGPVFRPVEARFHLVMTNFCPWITIDSWTKMLAKNPKESEQLLHSWPWPQQICRPPGSRLDHLGWLRGALPNDTCWMAHGAAHVSEPFDDLVRSLELTNWGFARNLGSAWSRF